MAGENVMCPSCEVRGLLDGKCAVCGYTAKAKAEDKEKGKAKVE